jgi:hypothetical protein
LNSDLQAGLIAGFQRLWARMLRIHSIRFHTYSSHAMALGARVPADWRAAVFGFASELRQRLRIQLFGAQPTLCIERPSQIALALVALLSS